MVSSKYVEDQLKRAGCKFQLWGRAELKELCSVLMENEEIRECLNGHYEGGFALLCATNHRILLIDKKPMYLTLEDVRYDMIAEIQFSHRLLDATVRIFTPTKSLSFTSWNRTHLRKLVMGAQQHVMEIRQYQNMRLNGLQPTPQTTSFVSEPEQPARAVPTASTVELSPITMPQPIIEQFEQTTPTIAAPKSIVDPSRALSAMAISSATRSDLQDVDMEAFGSVMNPFLRAPLITRNRGTRW